MIKRAASLISLHISVHKPWERVIWFLAAAVLFDYWAAAKVTAYNGGAFTSQFFSVFLPMITFDFFYHDESVMMKSSPNSILSQVYLPPVLCSAFLIFDAILTYILICQAEMQDCLKLISYSALAAAEMVILPAAFRKFRYALLAGVMVCYACSTFSSFEEAIAVPFAGIISVAVIIVGCIASICVGKHFYGQEKRFTI